MDCYRDGSKMSMSDGIHFLKAYAHLHATFWKLPHVNGLQKHDNWLDVFPELCWAEKRDRDKIRLEIGWAKILKHMNSRATTLCHGDAHVFNVLKLEEHSSYAEKHGRWLMCDFGHALVASPAVDV